MQSHSDRVWRAEVSDFTFTREGLAWGTREATTCNVDGTQMARLPHETIVEIDGFHASKREAELAAASRIEELGRRLLAQAERIRNGDVQAQAVA